jgi:hypothetical protein
VDDEDNPDFDAIMTSGQYFVKTLQKSFRNVRLQFLILLRDEDYDKCFFSYRDMIAYRKNFFPGDLILEKYEDCHQLPYYIQEPVLPRQLYIMLPKEKKFIPSNIFTEHYIKSKMRELIEIFAKLNARSIKFTRYDSQNDMSNLTLEASSTVPQAHISNINRIEHEDSSYSGLQYEMILQPNRYAFDIQDFFDNESFYYLKQEPSWQDMIRRRVDYHMTYDKYSYRNNETKLLKGKFVSKLKLLNMDAEYDWEKYKEFMIDYEISYYFSF